MSAGNDIRRKLIDDSIRKLVDGNEEFTSADFDVVRAYAAKLVRARRADTLARRFQTDDLIQDAVASLHDTKVQLDNPKAVLREVLRRRASDSLSKMKKQVAIGGRGTTTAFSDEEGNRVNYPEQVQASESGGEGLVDILDYLDSTLTENDQRRVEKILEGKTISEAAAEEGHSASYESRRQKRLKSELKSKLIVGDD